MSIQPPGVTAPPDAAGTWLDDVPVPADWAPPTATGPALEPPVRRVSAVLVLGVILLALALVIGAIWALGGFKLRSDVFRDVPVGSVIATGPYELSFTEVTVQRSTDFGGATYWKVTALGSGRTTGSATIAPETAEAKSMFVAKDSESQEVESPSGARFGAADASLDRNAFAPGLGPIPYEVTFKFTESYRPGADLRFIVYDLDFYDNSLLKDGDEAWHNSNHGSRVFLPVRMLPDNTY